MAEGLSALTYQVLLALADGDRHGYGIIKEIEARSGEGAAPSTGALYLALQRMERSGFVEESPSRPAPAEDDGRRRYYRLTEEGRRTAEGETRRLAALVGVAVEKQLIPATALPLGRSGHER
ncbi:MAG: PadR family transcriptional regulator [Longimicrobiales bacterium]